MLFHGLKYLFRKKKHDVLVDGKPKHQRDKLSSFTESFPRSHDKLPSAGGRSKHRCDKLPLLAENLLQFAGEFHWLMQGNVHCNYLIVLSCRRGKELL